MSDIRKSVYNVMVEKVEELKRMVRFNAFGGTTDYEKNFLLNELEHVQIKFEQARDAQEGR
jgi:hypothetical protein